MCDIYTHQADGDEGGAADDNDDAEEGEEGEADEASAKNVLSAEEVRELLLSRMKNKAQPSEVLITVIKKEDRPSLFVLRCL
jgi:hypothetical protein